MGGPCTQSWVQLYNYYTKMKHGIKSPPGGFELYSSFAVEYLKMVIHKHCHAFWKDYNLDNQGRLLVLRFCPVGNHWQRRCTSFAGLHVMGWKIQWERCAKLSRPYSTGIVGKSVVKATSIIILLYAHYYDPVDVSTSEQSMIQFLVRRWFGNYVNDEYR